MPIIRYEFDYISTDRPMIGAFKFMQRRYKEQFPSGRIRFGRLHYYRRPGLSGDTSMSSREQGSTLDTSNLPHIRL